MGDTPDEPQGQVTAATLRGLWAPRFRELAPKYSKKATNVVLGAAMVCEQAASTIEARDAEVARYARIVDAQEVCIGERDEAITTLTAELAEAKATISDAMDNALETNEEIAKLYGLIAADREAAEEVRDGD